MTSSTAPSTAPSTATKRTRRQHLRLGVAAGGAVSLAACEPLGFNSTSTRQPAALSGPFDLLIQTGLWTMAVQQQIDTLREREPGVQVNLVPGKSSDELAEKIRATTAAGTPPDGFFHYSHTWRGVNAAAMMLPLTPRLFRRDEIERMSTPTLLKSVWAKDNEIYFLPWIMGLGATRILYNAPVLAGRGVDPNSMTTLDAVASAAGKAVVREGGAITTAGLLFENPENLLQNWILDQGATFYDEKARTWTWQTPAAERALQWMVDAYDKLGLAWRTPPPGVDAPFPQGRVGMLVGAGCNRLGGFVANQDVYRNLGELPMPSFAPGKEPHYYVPGIAGFSLAAALKPDSVKAKIGATLYRMVLSPDGSMILANSYSGGILMNSVYTDPRFKDTTFAAFRARLPQEVLARTLMLNLVTPDSTTQPDFAANVLKALNGVLSVKAALGEIQSLFDVKEAESWRALLGTR